jgi:hypothetical protein
MEHYTLVLEEQSRGINIHVGSSVDALQQVGHR